GAPKTINGQTKTLVGRSGWESPLDAALFHSHMDRATLDAMRTAGRESFPHVRRYLRAKARRLGLPMLAWYDLFAPVGETTKVWGWDDGTRFIVNQFGSYSPRLSDFAARAFRERWIDAEPRPGKVGGAFCM